ncbi:MAG: hypothetical protein GWN58_40675, partial [Anaerolineae bacterium]|nr:hypothetical protein [Anaerolineae bacterium]
AIAGIDAGTSGTIYLDEFVFRDDATEIGAVSAAEEEVTGYMTPMRGWWGP